ncbi:MAG TPA: ABC transporter permease [Thermodesulfobacteriota bacterium]|nr:ABC transporter permease [Thermodesulfobacteriota bacterium]
MQKAVEKLIRRSGFLPLLVLLLLISGSFIPNFFTFQNGMNVLRQTTYLAIITIGEMLVFLVGGFDLAIGAVVALTSIVAALIMASGISESSFVLTILGILGGLAVSTLVGLVNGLTVAVIRVAPFIVTVATMGISSGLALHLAGGTPVWGLTKPFIEIFGSGSFYGVPNVVLIAVIVSIIMYLLLNMTYLGRYFWAIGGNENAALLSGINTRKYTVLAYTLCGFFSGFTGVLLTARVGAGEPVLGGGLMLQAMAAAVIGGTRVGGGEGNIPGALLGALFITLVGNAMNLANIGSYVQLIVMGCLLMFAIISDRYVRR